MEREAPKALTVSWSFATCIPGYEPSWVDYTGDDWARAYEWARARVRCIGNSRQSVWRSSVSNEAIYTALRDGEDCSVDVLTDQGGIVLGRPFTPERIGTVRITHTTN